MPAIREEWRLEWHANGEMRSRVVDRALRLGRGPGNDIALDSAAVSHHHCTITPSAVGVVAEATSRPFKVDGRETRRAVLGEGALFLVGDTVLRVARADAPDGDPGCSLSWVAEGGSRRVAIGGTITVGRAPTNTIVLADRLVSRTHCTLSPTPRGVRIDARGSANGILVNGQRLPEAEVPFGGSFVVGQTAFGVGVPAVQAQGPSSPRRSSAPLLAGVAGIAAVLVVALLLGFVVLRSGGPESAPGSVLVSQRITAAGGGSLTVPGGPVVTVPPGAVPADVTATVRLPAQRPKQAILGRFASPVYDIDLPALSAPARISFPAPGATLPDGDQLSIVHLDHRTGQWVPLESALSADGTAVTAQSVSFSPTALVAGPEFRMPFAQGTTIAYSGGPHAWNAPPGKIAVNKNSSGIDFAGSFEVLAIAPGEVVAVHFSEENTTEVNNLKPGNYVILRHEGGIQSEYWHLDGKSSKDLWKKDELKHELKAGDKVPAGYPIGVSGYSGNQVKKDKTPIVHLHLELSQGRTAPGEANVTSWEGQRIDGWVIHQHLVAGQTRNGYSYQGSAVRGPARSAKIEMDTPKETADATVGEGFVTGEDGKGTKEVYPDSPSGCRVAPEGECTVFADERARTTLPSTNVLCTHREKQHCREGNLPSDDSQPGGIWLKAPANGETLTGSSYFLRAEARKGSHPIERVEFTVWWPALGPEGGPWKVACAERAPQAGGAYECALPLAGIPDGPMRVSFDVYDTSGASELAPNGTRLVMRAARCTSCGVATPGPSVPPPTPGVVPTPARPDVTPIRTVSPPPPTPTPVVVPSATRTATPAPTSTPTPAPTRTPIPTPTPPPDSDRDGIPDGDDGCPGQAGPRSNAGCPVSYQLRLDISEGVQFHPGDVQTFCYGLSPQVPFEFTLEKSNNGGPYANVWDDLDDGKGDCLQFTVGSELGGRTYRGRAFVNGQLVATRLVTAVVTSVAQPTPTPRPATPPGGSCDREPSSPTNFSRNGNTVSWQVVDPGGAGCVLQFEVNAFSGPNLYRGAAASYTSSALCPGYYFVGAANQKFGFHFYSLWTC